MVKEPLPSHVLLHQEEKRLNEVGVRNELAIKVAEAHK